MRTISITFVFSICTALLLGGPTVQAAAVSCAAPVISTATSSVVELKKDSEPQPREDKPKKSKKNDGKDGDPDDGNSGKGNDDKTLPNDGPAAD